jgi:ketosteroid isomerase-like protein
MPDHVAIVQDLYQCFLRGDVPAILAKLHPDVEWEPDTIDHGIPWIRPGRGHVAVAAFFATVRELEFHAFEPRAFLKDERHVAVIVHHDVTVRSTGKRMAGLEVHYWTFDGEGRIVAMKHFVDTAQHAAAAAV